MGKLIKPHGGKLVNLRVNEIERKEIEQNLNEFFKIDPGIDTLMDAEKIGIGAFSPLTGFMDKETLDCVLRDMRLCNGIPWSLPILFLVEEGIKGKLKEGKKVLLMQKERPIALLEVTEIYPIDPEYVAEKTFGTRDPAHPGVNKLMNSGRWAIAGPIKLINFVEHPWRKYELTPEETREIFEERGWEKVVAFQTRNAPHRAHEYLQRIALEVGDGLLIQPILGSKKKDDFDNETIIRAYNALITNYFPENRVLLSGLSTQMRYAGPREAVFHAIVRKNYGASHFMVGRDHAGVGNYYDPFAAHRIFDEFTEDELGIEIIKFGNVFYCKKCGGMASDKTCRHEDEFKIKISMTKIRGMLREGKVPPEEMIRPEVAKVLIEFFK